MANNTAAVLVGPAKAQREKQVRADKLSRMMYSAAQFNASDAPEMTSPPTITAVASPVTSVTLRPTVTDQAALFTMYGAKPFLQNSQWNGISVTRPGGGIVDATHDAISFRIRFWHTGSTFDILTIGSTGNRVRVLVNGQFANKAGTNTLTNTGPNWINVNFGSRATRLIDLEFEKGGSFGGINVASADSIVRVDLSSKYSIGVVGDSITASTGVVRGGDGYVEHAGRRLGNMDLDIWPIGIGSTGYLNDGVGAGTTTWRFSSHLDDLLFTTFDEVWMVGGINDSSADLPGLKAAATLTWQGARQRVGPTVPIIVWGVFAGPPAYSAAFTKETALKEAFDQWADPYSVFVPFRGVRPIQTGGTLDASVTGSITGTTLTTTAVASGALAIGQVLMAADILPETFITAGSGSSWTVSKSQTMTSQTIGASNPANGNFGFWGGGLNGLDTIHPSKIGHDYIGSWMAAARRSLVLP